MLGKSSYDYIVIGSGSAGAIVATRLSEDKSVSVLLIEAGGSDKNIFIKMPTALGIPMNTRKFNWGFKSEPERFLNDRIMNCPRGRYWEVPHQLMEWCMSEEIHLILMNGKY